MEEMLIENHVVKNLGKLFPGTQLIERNKTLPGGYNIDLHLVNKKKDRHTFVEIKNNKIRRNRLGQILNFYSAISNIEPPIKNFKLVIVGKTLDRSAKDVLNRLGIAFTSLSELGISEEIVEKMLRERRKHRLRMLTPIEARLVSEWETTNIKIVTIDDVARKLGSPNQRIYARTIVHRLENKKWLERIKRGVYLFIPVAYGYEERFPPMDPLIVGSVLVKPYYYSYATSNAHYGYTTQIRPVVYIATLKARRDFKWRTNKFKFIALSKSKFFGYHEVEIQDTKVNMAEPEKSIIDTMDKVKYAGGIEEAVSVVCNGLKKRGRKRRKQIDCGKLVDYAERMESHSLAQRLGFMLDFLMNERLIKFPSRERKRLLKLVGKTTIYLAPIQKYIKGGRLNQDWNIIQNISKDQLLSEIAIR